MDNPTSETYGGLQRAYDHFDEQLFAGTMPGALITLQRKKGARGYFSSERFGNRKQQYADEIAMNPEHFGIRSIAETLSTLVHEMVHQWQQHHGKPGRGRYHNAEWADLMDKIGLVPSSTGLPGGRRVGDRMTHFIAAGGPFAVACEELLTAEFTLQWFDRFVAREVVSRARELTVASRSADPSVVEQEIQTLSADGDQDRLRPDLVAPGLLEPPEQTGGDKTKYSCSTCPKDGRQTNVWGRPGLRLVCGFDGSPLQAQPAISHR